MKEKKIGFIGQGWIGKNYADDFEKRGYDVVRYSLEEPFVKNSDNIKECDIVFIAVPTPSTPEGFDSSILKSAIKGVGPGTTVIIKSTIFPGITASLQKEFKDLYIMHSPEFLVEVTAKHDAANPNRNIIGIPEETDVFLKKAQEVMDILPRAPYEKICRSGEAELVKYGGNNFLFFKVIFANMFYDLVDKLGCDWETVKEAMVADPRIGSSHLTPIHKSGRGAGGHCFIKDFSALTEMYEKYVGDKYGNNLLDSLKTKNIDLLTSSKKDLDLLKGVYGDNNFKNN